MLRPTHALAIVLAATGLVLSAGASGAQQIPSGPAAPAAKGAKAGKGGDAAEAGQAKKDPQAAQKALDSGIKSYEAGKLEPAVQTLTFALRGGGLQPQQMAKALHYRGLAYRKQGKPALAISDLTSALWLKGGLGEADRASAMEARAGAYREAGLGEAPQMADAGARAGKAAASPVAVEKPAAAPSNGWQAATTSGRSAPTAATTAAPVLSAVPTGDGPPLAVAAAPAPSGGTTSGGTTSGGVGSFFGNLFGGGATAGTAKPASEPSVTASTGPAAATSSWANSTAVAPAKGVRTAAAAPSSVVTAPASPAAAAPQPAQPAFKGKFRLQVAAVRSRAEADALAKKLKDGHGSAISGREPIVEEAVLGAMGTFYRVRVGPYADANEPRQLCSRIKPDGFDCLVVTQ